MRLAKITLEQRTAILRLLAKGQNRGTIANEVGVTPGQVSAIQAHVKMGTYALPRLSEELPGIQSQVMDGAQRGATRHPPKLVRPLEQDSVGRDSAPSVRPVLLGTDAETNEEVFWNPDPDSGSANPHVLVVGESGFGKTYTISCLLAELGKQGVHSIVFDYAQGFTAASWSPDFVRANRPVEIHASRDGVEINPLQIFPSDLHGPVNVAQRVADTFGRVYPKIGVQQHAVIRQATLDVLADRGILPEAEQTWMSELPAFDSLQEKLQDYADRYGHAQSRVASLVASHISTMFVFRTFRRGGCKVAWSDVTRSESMVFVIQLKGLEYSAERAVTEFLLWNLIGYVESLGPGPLRCFVVLDEAHKLSLNAGSPVEKLLREGRKFGLGIILSSQQAEDFSPVAFANTATKLVFQVGDEGRRVSRQLQRKVKNLHSLSRISDTITKLPRGHAYAVTDNKGAVVSITPFRDRSIRWRDQQRSLRGGQTGKGHVRMA